MSSLPSIRPSSQAAPGADGPAAARRAPAHGPRAVHGRHPERGARDGQPQPRLLAARLQVRTSTPRANNIHTAMPLNTTFAVSEKLTGHQRH